MKVVFLDVDGVLNFVNTEARTPSGYTGIAESCVKNLKQIIKETGAYIILVSTWKQEWEKDEDACSPDGLYLIKKLKRHGLHIIDKTEDHIDNRGEGIYNWLKLRDNVTDWIVLDDEIFKDYEKYNILPHLIQTSFSEHGLAEDHVQRAISILNGGSINCE